ncbi:MAG: hypothetical protein IJ461_01665 [Clostridia bacterium]|nr:hypothetical protein [Clostridia bacterium]
MRIQPAVQKETKKIALWTGILTVLMIVAFMVLKRFDYTVITGALAGYLMAVGNFFLMALSVQKAAESMKGVHVAPAPEDEEGEEPPLSEEAQKAGKRVQHLYTLRMLVIVVLAVLLINLPWFNSLASLIPLLFPHIVVMINSFVLKSKGEA